MGVKQISSGSAGLSVVAGILGRYHEYRLVIGGSPGQGFNDGDIIAFPIQAFARFAQVDSGAGATLGGLFGSAGPTYRQVDGRRAIQFTPAAAARVCAAWRPHGGTNLFPIDLRNTFGAVTSAVLASLPAGFGFACSHLAWCRKVLAGDSSSSRMTFGFADNTITSPSAPVARFGILGDGAGGYRFGSVNCPDGLIAGDNADGDVDAGSVQPAELVAPGTSWFHVRIKTVPATPTQGGRWAAYLNGRLVATFTNPANFARGSQTTSYEYTRQEPSLLNFGDPVGTKPGLMFADVRLWLEDDYSI